MKQIAIKRILLAALLAACGTAASAPPLPATAV
jgi:hypothetical protein